MYDHEEDFKIKLILFCIYWTLDKSAFFFILEKYGVLEKTSGEKARKAYMNEWNIQCLLMQFIVLYVNSSTVNVMMPKIVH